MTLEVWAAVSGFAYVVSNLGNVRSAKNMRNLSPMRTGSRRAGAQRSKVRLSTVPRIDKDVAHLVLEAFISARPVGMVAMHRNDNSADNRLCNLHWGTAADNAQDAVRKGRGGSQKLSVEQSIAIAQRRSCGERGVDLAVEFGVSQQRICDIFRGRVATDRESEMELKPTEGIADLTGANLIHAVEDLMQVFFQQAGSGGMTAEEMRAATELKKQLKVNRKLYGMEV